MKDITALKDVAEFHSTFGHPVQNTPAIPSADRCKLRVALIQEELNELQQAINDNNIVEVADALCDLQYVLSGAVLEFGLADKFHDLFKEVQRSNMSKACLTVEQAEATVKHYGQQGIECSYTQHDGKYLVHRNTDNKVMKSIYYSPANLKSILQEEPETVI